MNLMMVTELDQVFLSCCVHVSCMYTLAADLYFYKHIQIKMLQPLGRVL